MVTELLYVPYILVSIPCLIFVISILLFLFFSASAGTYNSLSLVATLYIFQELPQYCLKLTVGTRLLNRLHSHQQYTAAIYIYISISVSCDTKNISIHFELPAISGQTANCSN